MGLFGTPKMSAPAPPPPPPTPATMASSQTQGAGSAQRAAVAGANGAGFDNTITNAGGSAGVQASTAAGKSLLGQ
jgi:hypothetical protein